MNRIVNVFDNGLRVVLNQTEKTKPVSIMFGVNTGSVNESQENNGVSHFIEHMVFKGTTGRTAQDISKDLEGIGANANAFTSKFHTCFYATCMIDEVEKCFEILSDMFFDPLFSQEDIDKERKVIFEEIDMYEDDPGSVAYDDFTKNFFLGTKVEKSVIGTKESLKNINREQIVEYKNQFYTAPNIVITVSGGLEENEFLTLIKKYALNKLPETKFLAKEVDYDKDTILLPEQKFNFIKKNIAQTHIVMGFPAKTIYSDDRMAYTLLSFIVGGGMSSRLFIKIREELGLVYGIHCLPDLYDCGGTVSISLATNHSQQKMAVKTIKEELEKLIKEGVTQEELDRAKIFCKTLIVTSSETSTNTTRHSTSDMLIYNKIRTVEEKLESIQKVTLEQINKLIRESFSFKNMCASVVSDKIDETIFDCFC